MTTTLTGNEQVVVLGTTGGSPSASTEVVTTQQIANLGGGSVTYPITVANGGTGSTTALAARAALSASTATLTYNTADYGIVADGIALSNLTTTASSTTVSSATYTFGAGDVGKFLTIAGAGTSSAVLNVTISSVSGGNAVISAAAGTSIAGTGVGTFGTDNSTAFNTLVTTVNTAGGGLIVLQAGIYVIAGTITWKSLVSLTGQGWGKSIIKWISTGSMTSAMIQGTSGTKDIQYINCQFTNFEMDCDAATQASYNVAGKCLYIQYMTSPLFQNLYLHGSPATGLGCDHLRYALITGCIVNNCGRLNSGSSLGGAGIGIAIGGSFPSTSYPESTIVEGCTIIFCKRYGIFFESVGAGVGANVWINVQGNIVWTNSGNGIGDSGNTNMIIAGNTIYGTSGNAAGISVDDGTLVVGVGQKGLIQNNIVTGCANGISINYTGNDDGSTVCQYCVKNNKIELSTSNGIIVTTLASTLLDTLDISGNQVLFSTLNGIYLTGTGNMKNVSIKGNKSNNNSGAGFKADCAIAGLSIVGNDFLDDQASATQTYGINFNSASATITDAFIVNNKLTGNVTAAYALTSSATLAGQIITNDGYNPVGAASVTPGSSPWTYTAGVTPEVLYIYSGTVSVVAKNSVTLRTSSPASIALDPNEAVTITYSVAPTAAKDLK